MEKISRRGTVVLVASVLVVLGFLMVVQRPTHADTCGDQLAFLPIPDMRPRPYSPPAPAPRCGAAGASCSSGAACCSGTCNGGGCAACRQPGFACTANSDCCSGSCDTLTFSAGACN